MTAPFVARKATLTRRGNWLFAYRDIKYTTRMEWRMYLISGLTAFILGLTGLILLVRAHAKFHGIPMLVCVCAILWGVLYAPAAVIYEIRHRRGEPTDFFDYEDPKYRK